MRVLLTCSIAAVAGKSRACLVVLVRVVCVPLTLPTAYVRHLPGPFLTPTRMKVLIMLSRIEEACKIQYLSTVEVAMVEMKAVAGGGKKRQPGRRCIRKEANIPIKVP